MKKLVDTRWLAEHQDDPNLIIIDAAPSEEYKSLHVKNAVSASFGPDVYMSYGINTSYGGGIDLFSDPESTIPFQDGPPEYIGEIVRSWGVNNESTVLVYDNGANFLATRVFWTLTHHGKDNVYVLDGGFEKYLMDDMETESIIAEPARGNFEPNIKDSYTVVDTGYVLDNILNPEITLVDANLSTWYHGGILAYSRPGHIPFAINIPYDSYYRDDMTWKPVEQLKQEFESRGVYPDKEIIVYCGGNPAGSSLYFAIKHVVGYPKVRFYLKSLAGWLADERALPLFTYANDQMIRDSAWMRWFGGKRMQTLLRDVKVRVVDVRSSRDYQAGHIPFAINLPCEELFFSKQMDRNGWENLLGANGISSEMEVVIYGQSTLFSSMLFWLLDRLGHEKISLLNGGLSAWMEQGFEVTTDETPIAPPRHNFDVAFSPMVYKARNHGRGSLEGQKDTAIIPDISWKECVTDQDKFKSAGELAATFESRHIYKTQQIFCSRPDFAEATFVYFILKLMGYRQVDINTPSNIVDL